MMASIGHMISKSYIGRIKAITYVELVEAVVRTI